MAAAVLNLVRWPLVLLLILVQLYLVVWFLWAAYDLRMYPIKDFGYTIHEFDPWFNVRAAEYMAENGMSKFFKWYDYKSWYPIGRPIGTTIYPGMQITAVAIWEAMKIAPAVSYDVPKEFRNLIGRVSKYMEKKGFLLLPYSPKKLTIPKLDVNAICCMIPAWFGSIAALFNGLLTYEVSRSVNAGVMGVGVMAFIPAHLMRSVGGKFDNECVAMAAIVSTFWLWLLSVRTPSHWPVGVLTGLSYVYMVASWGGYIFVLNMIGLHALMIVGLGRFNSGVHKAYSLFYIVGTIGAIQIPVVGWTPLRSVEQLGPLGVFLGYQVLAYCDTNRVRRKMAGFDFVKFRVMAFVGLIAVLAAAMCVLAPMGYFGPLSSRIRGLFMKHTKTGNPLVDSVAEHQPANAGMYNAYLNLPLDYMFVGGLVCLPNRNHGVYFLALYGVIATHFSGKMSRLVLICAPIVSVVCAIWLGFLLDFIMNPFFLFLGKSAGDGDDSVAAEESNGHKNGATAAKEAPNSGTKAKKGGNNPRRGSGKSWNIGSGSDWKLEEWEEDYRPGGIAQFKRIAKSYLFSLLAPATQEQITSSKKAWTKGSGSFGLGRVVLSVVVLFYIAFLTPSYGKTLTFIRHCDQVAKSMSNAHVKYHGQRGEVIDDPWAGYKWLSENTPEDSRVMSWWDYGYQITGIGKRTTLADGNTWNHEQIATIGRFLSSSQKRSHNSVRHLADYVLVWAGGSQNDLAISTHFARIGNSVFPDHCGDSDPYCQKYGFHGGNDFSQPTPMMKASLVYNLVGHNQRKGAQADPKLFEEVHTTPRGHIRIFKVLNVSQESKDWVADPKNRICDAPGSWYCIGQYPPAMAKLLAKRGSFAQVEDFNKGGEKSAYTKMIEKQRASEL